MSAGPRILYYGVGRTKREIFGLLDPETYMVKEYESDDEEDRYLDYSYMDAIKKILKDSDFNAKFVQYVNTLYSKEETDLKKVACVYGFKIVEFRIYDNWEASLETDKHLDELQRLKEKFTLEQEPKLYCIYTGN